MYGATTKKLLYFIKTGLSSFNGGILPTLLGPALRNAGVSNPPKGQPYGAGGLLPPVGPQKV